MCRGDIRQGWVSKVDVLQCAKQNIGVRVSSFISILKHSRAKGLKLSNWNSTALREASI